MEYSACCSWPWKYKNGVNYKAYLPRNHADPEKDSKLSPRRK